MLADFLLLLIWNYPLDPKLRISSMMHNGSKSSIQVACREKVDSNLLNRSFWRIIVESFHQSNMSLSSNKVEGDT